MTLQQQFEIYSKYIGDFTVPYKGPAPYRVDASPSFGIYRRGENLYFKDFAGPGGDVYKFVEIMGDSPIKYTKIKGYKEREIKIPKYRLWSEFLPHHLEYWGQRGVSKEDLVREKIYPVCDVDFEYYMISDSPATPVFLYYFDKDAFKIYNPYAEDKKYKFRNINTYDLVAGKIPELKESTLFICSSKKDMVVLNNHIKDFIPADYTDLLSESTFQKLINYLRDVNHYKRILYFGDWDDSAGQKNVKKGVEWAQSIERYSKGLIKSVVVPEDLRIQLLERGIKDIDDLRITAGEENTKTLLRYILSKNN